MKLKEKFRYIFYVVCHPFDGFYEVRHRQKGSVFLAILLILWFGFSFSFNRRYASFVVNNVNPRAVDCRMEMLAILAAVILFATANWSITCLMEGEGRFKDIVTVVGYAMLPMGLAFLPATFISQFIASNEEGFYYVLLGISIIWFLLLVLIGIMTVHNFEFGKTILTIILTFVAMLFIIFIILLLVTLIQQVIEFFKGIYTELIMRV
ncbi:MAG TPA: Yip1 family protein [Lachnospiraceae bacterium]|nr:Yip1 family protein [Lachnospiraceae bacterium]